MLIDTPLLVVGSGPAALVVAKLASSYGVASLVAGHNLGSDETEIVLSDDAVAALDERGVFDVFRPYLSAANPPTISAAAFEEVLKHHCVVDMAVTVYDGMTLTQRPDGSDKEVTGVLSDSRSLWDIHADHFVDASTLPTELNAAIVAGAHLARSLVAGSVPP